MFHLQMAVTSSTVTATTMPTQNFAVNTDSDDGLSAPTNYKPTQSESSVDPVNDKASMVESHSGMFDWSLP